VRLDDGYFGTFHAQRGHVTGGWSMSPLLARVGLANSIIQHITWLKADHPVDIG
jgi:hypothetical protein